MPPAFADNPWDSGTDAKEKRTPVFNCWFVCPASRRCSSCSVSFMALRQSPIIATYLEPQGDSRATRMTPGHKENYPCTVDAEW